MGTRTALPGRAIAIAGCIGLMIGPFLPWATALLLSLTGMEYTDGVAIVLLVLGVVGIVATVASGGPRRRGLLWVTVFVGLAGLGLSIYYLLALREELPRLVQGLVAAALGPGLYVCLVAGVLVIVGGVLAAWNSR